MKVSASGGLVFVSFDDSDLVCYDVFAKTVYQRYLTFATLTQHFGMKYAVDFEILEQADLSGENTAISESVAERSNNELRHIPLVVAFSDGQVAEVHCGGPRRLIATGGVNSANERINCIRLLCDEAAAEVFYRQNLLQKQVRSTQLANALQQR